MVERIDIQEIPVDLIGLDPRPERQIRPLDLEHVRALMETTNPEEWDPVEVRLWPESDPYPDGEEDRLYQVISGYHRTTAARNLGLETIHAVVITESLDEMGFQLRAFRTNARHGKPMSTDEKQSLAQRLRALGMSENEIAREMGTPKGTIHNWLSGRNTNSSRKKEVVRTHQASGDSGDDTGLPDAWRVPLSAEQEVELDARQVAQVAGTIHTFLAGTPTHLAPGDAIAWAHSLSPQMRRAYADDLEQTIHWLGYLRSVLLGMKTETEGAA